MAPPEDIGYHDLNVCPIFSDFSRYVNPHCAVLTAVLVPMCHDLEKKKPAERAFGGIGYVVTVP
jgi:hypothetical protein